MSVRAKFSVLALLASVACVASGACGAGRGHAPAFGGIVPGVSGFRPARNGFRFANYGDDLKVTDLTPAEMRRLFGDRACVAVVDGACTLTPPARQWMAMLNRGMGGGHCEGLAVLSLLLHEKKLDPAALGAGSAWDLEFDGNPKLQREIAYWFATQATQPTMGSVIRKTPKEILALLGESFQPGVGHETYTLGIWKPGLEGGHAITPYGVVDQGGGVYKVMVYDNNYPGAERSVLIDTVKNVWSYQGSQNPKQGVSQYAGDATTFTLDLTPTSARTRVQECGFCGDLIANQAPVGRRQLIIDGAGDVLATDDAGHKIGNVKGLLVNEIPGAKAFGWKNAPAAEGHAPIYDLPAGGGLTVTLDGTRIGGAKDTSVTLIGAGYALAVTGLDLAPGQKDTLTMSKLGNQVSYQTDGKVTPALQVSLETPGIGYGAIGYVVSILALGDEEGKRIDIKVELDKERLRILATSKSGRCTYSIVILRVAQNLETEFVHRGVRQEAHGAMYINYGAWTGVGNPMKVETDKDGDGTIDTLESWQNSNGLNEGYEPWKGRIVSYGVDFDLEYGEEVAFGDNGPVVTWQNDTNVRDDRVFVQLVLSRHPPDLIPGGLHLVEGTPLCVAECSMLLVKTEPDHHPPRKATLRVSCGAPCVPPVVPKKP